MILRVLFVYMIIPHHITQKKRFLHTIVKHVKSARPHHRERTPSCRMEFSAYAFFAVSFSITSSVLISSATASARLSTTLCMKPAKMYATKLTPATVIA